MRDIEINGKIYMSGKNASKILGVHQRTLYQWEEKGKIETIRTPGNKRLYNVNKYLALQEKPNKDNNDCIKNLDILDNKQGKLKLSYVRVSSLGQQDDLERQKRLIKKKYPNHLMIEDIGSGINFNRKGLRKIIRLAIEGRIDELVVAYKDRLTRFGYELIEDMIKEYSGGKIIISEQIDDMEPEEELVKDVLQIMNVYVAKMNGLRKYKINKKKNKKK